MRVWKMNSTPSLLCTIRAAVNRLDCVNSMCCDSQQHHVAVGDTGGHVRVWQLDSALESRSGRDADACFSQVYSTVSPSFCSMHEQLPCAQPLQNTSQVVRTVRST